MVRISGRFTTCPGCGQRRGVNTNDTIRRHRRLGAPCPGAGDPASPPPPAAAPRVVLPLRPRPPLYPDNPWDVAQRRALAAELAVRLGNASVTTGGTITVHTPGAIVGGRRQR